jgi:raffinose/stachyose/melibiose transport system permease protein
MSNFWLAFRNSVVTTIPTVALTTFICASASYIIARRNDRLYNTVYYLFLMALLIPFQMIMLPLYVNLRNWGLLNTLLGFVLAKTGFSIAYNVLIMTGFVKTVPKEIEEAALIDGAGKWTAFWKWRSTS